MNLLLLRLKIRHLVSNLKHFGSNIDRKINLDQVSLSEAVFLKKKTEFRVNLDCVRYPGGMAYTQNQHHFLRYYNDGWTGIKNYYEKHQPKNIFEQHFVSNDYSTGRENTLPWEGLEGLCPRADTLGECGLPLKHGIQHYGPVSDLKVEIEIVRLKHVLKSISKQGYKSSRGGFPKGYALRNNEGSYRFILTSGRHRVAALAFLKYRSIVCVFDPRKENLIDEALINRWPGIRSGDYTIEGAKAIFDAYFRDNNDILF